MNSHYAGLYANNQAMLSRILLSLTLAIALLVAPFAILDLKAALTSKMSCHIRVPVDPCHGCPINSPTTNSNSACCSAQAPCFVSFVNNGDDFIAGMHSASFASMTNDRVNTRSQRPPVPPPRLALTS